MARETGIDEWEKWAATGQTKSRQFKKLKLLNTLVCQCVCIDFLYSKQKDNRPDGWISGPLHQRRCQSR